MDRLAMPLLKVVKNDNVMAASHKNFGGDAANIAGTAGNEYFHR